MKKNTLLICAFYCAFSFGQVLNAQTWQTEHVMTMKDGPKSQSNSDLNDLSWIAGNWGGEGLGGEVEEVWTGPAHGHMFGIFRFHNEDGLVFSEFCSISETTEGIEYRVKHFSNSFEGWEEKTDYVTFPLIKIENQTAYFDGATFKRDGDVLTIYVVVRSEQDKREESFVYHKQ